MLSDAHRKAVRYWELRRILFIVMLWPAASFGWSLANSLNYGIDEMPPAYFSDVRASDFIFDFLALNVFFSLGYVAEYFLGAWRYWIRPFRTLLFLALCLVGMYAALDCAGHSAERISLMKAQWPGLHYQPLHRNPATKPNPK